MTAHLWHGYFLEALGQQSANLAERKLGQELDPLNLAAGTGVGTAYFYLGLVEAGIQLQGFALLFDGLVVALSFIKGKSEDDEDPGRE